MITDDCKTKKEKGKRAAPIMGCRGPGAAPHKLGGAERDAPKINSDWANTEIEKSKSALPMDGEKAPA